MPEGRTLRLQQAMASLVLDADEEALEADLGRVARRHDLSPADQQAFRSQTEAFLTYRELARMSLIEPLETMFPVLKALLEKADQWEACVQAFLDARVIRSGHYRDIAPAFLGWLAATGWGQDRWPFLLELAHAEILEVLVARFPDTETPMGLHDEPTVEDRLVLEPATQVVSYGHAVHRTTEHAPVPESLPTHLLAYRTVAGEAKVLEVTPATAVLLVRAQNRSLREVAGDLNLTNLEPTLNLLRDLRRDGALAGFLTPTLP